MGIFWQGEKLMLTICLTFLFVFVGGYETFYSEYPECCVDVKPISQEKIENERALISQCGKPVVNVSYRPAYDQVHDGEEVSWVVFWAPVCRLSLAPDCSLPTLQRWLVLLWIRVLAKSPGFREPLLLASLSFHPRVNGPPSSKQADKSKPATGCLAASAEKGKWKLHYCHLASEVQRSFEILV